MSLKRVSKFSKWRACCNHGAIQHLKMSKRVVQFFLSAYKLLLPIKSYTRRRNQIKFEAHKEMHPIPYTSDQCIRTSPLILQSVCVQRWLCCSTWGELKFYATLVWNKRAQTFRWNYEITHVSQPLHPSLLHACWAWFEMSLGEPRWETCSVDIYGMQEVQVRSKH